MEVETPEPANSGSVRFCEPCKALQRGSRKIDRDGFLMTYYVHHETAASFQKALELNCALCVRLWTALEDDSWREPPVVGPTTYMVDTHFINFYCGNSRASLDLNPGIRSVVVGENSGERAALEFYVAQIKRCMQQHMKCNWDKSDVEFLPTRSLDVGSSADSFVRLCERKDFPPGTPYASLSHCWGKVQMATLTKGTASVLKRGIAIAVLPKTFQNAITVTRALGIRYIWIDSLCIFQDDPEDWRRESRRMRDVYRNAAFCIAATAAKDGDVGLFFDRDPQLFALVPLDFQWGVFKDKPPLRCGFSLGGVGLQIESAPLNRRAWVAQERYLSTRVLHFTRRLLYWECKQTISNECYPESLLGYNLSAAMALKELVDNRRYLNRACSRIVQDRVSLTEPLDTTDDDYDELLDAWDGFRQFYTRCSLTRDSDILVALHGIAEDVGEVMNDEMVVGLWRGRLFQELGWRIDPDSSRPFRPATWRAPSWSWASSAQIIHGSPFNKHPKSKFCKIVDIEIARNSLGDIIRAVLVLQCRLVPGSKIHLVGYALSRDEPVPLGEEEEEFYLIAIQRDDYDGRTAGIAIRQCKDEPECYKRIGSFDTRDTDLSIKRTYDSLEDQIIKII